MPSPGLPAPPRRLPRPHTAVSALLPPAAPCPSRCSGHGGFSQELGRSRRWLPRLPQLVAALRSDTPAHTVPNSQLIHQPGSPGEFPGSRCPGEGFQRGQGTGPPKARTLRRATGGRTEGLHHQHRIGEGSTRTLELRTRTPELLCPWCQDGREAEEKTALRDRSHGVTPLRQDGRATTILPPPLSCHHPLPNRGQSRRRCPFQPRALRGDRIFQGREQCLLQPLCSAASSSQGSSPASSSGVNVPRAW